MKKVAVTGGIASGKSSVCRIFRSCGAYVVNADEIVHQLLSPSTVIGQQVIKLLGTEIVRDDQLDRKKIAKKVFLDSQKLQALENLLHPAVLNEIEKVYRQIKDSKTYALFVAEIPLLYESESEKFYDAVIAVISEPENCKNRFQEATGYSSIEYERRMERQMHPEVKAAKANYVIINNGTFEELKEKALKIYTTLHTTV